jgi:hypothetical protein
MGKVSEKDIIVLATEWKRMVAAGICRRHWLTICLAGESGLLLNHTP